MHMYDITKQKKSQLEKVTRAKAKNQRIAEWIAQNNQISRANRIKECGSFIMWNYCIHCHHSEIVSANYCKDRFCAICAPKKANRIRYQILKTIEPHIKKDCNEWLFLTMTIKSVPGTELRKTVEGLLSASRKFFDRRPIEKVVEGYIRSLEITYNHKTGMYHPHIHMLLMVNKANYFIKGLYLTQFDYAEIWKQCNKLDYTPITDIRKVYDKEGYQSIKSAVIETAKYPVKLYNIPNKTVFDILDNALKGKQLITAGGVLRDRWRIKDHTEGATCCANPEIVSELYKWNTNGYKIVTTE